MRVAIDLHVHHDRARLLNLPDASQLHAIAEADGHVAAARKRSQVTGRHARQQEEDRRSARQNQHNQHRRRACQKESHTAIALSIDGLARGNAGRLRGTAHLHQHKGGHSHQHEGREREQKHAVHGQHRGCQHHQKRKNGQHVVVAFLVHGEQPHHHAEQHQVHGRSQEAVRKQRVVRRVEGHVAEREVVRHTRRHLKVGPLTQQIAA